MAELDEILGKKPAAKQESSVTVSAPEGEFSLKDLDPIFEKPAEPTEKQKNTPIAPPEVPSNIPEAAAAGAAVGYTAGKVFNPLELPGAKGVQAAEVNAELAKKSLERQQGVLQQAKAGHVSTIDEAFKELTAAKAQAEEASRKMNEALERARKLGAIPEPKAPAPTTVGSTIPVDEGAMRHNVKMGNIVDYNAVRKGITGTAAGLPEGSGRLSGYTQVGRVIVPSSLADASVYNQEQLAAQKELQAAEQAAEQARKNAASAQAKWQGLTKATPRTVTAAEVAATRAGEKAATAADKLAALQSAKPTGLQRAGVALSKVPGLSILGGALSGAELMKAKEDWEKKQYMDAVMSAMGGIGGGLSLVPHPATKAIGTLMTVPPLMYQGYKALNPPEPQQ